MQGEKKESSEFPWFMQTTPFVMHIDSEEDPEESRKKGLYDYYVEFPHNLDNIRSIAVTGHSLPKDIAPSMDANVDNWVEFSLTDGNDTENFNIQFPVRYYEYHTHREVTTSYIRVLEMLLNLVVSTSSVFGDGKVVFLVVEDSLKRTYIKVVSDKTAFGSKAGVEMKLLFATGNNKEKSAAVTMGFDGDSDVTSSAPTGSTAFQYITSPLPVSLVKYSFIDINIGPRLYPQFESDDEYRSKRIYLIPEQETPLFDQSTSDPEGITNKIQFYQTNIGVSKGLWIKMRLSDGSVPKSTKPHMLSLLVTHTNLSMDCPYLPEHKLLL